MDSPTKSNLMKFLDFSISKGLVKGNTGAGRKAACSKILEAFADDDDLSNIDVPSEVLKYNNRHPGQLSPDSLNAYQGRVQSALEEFKKYLASPTTYKGIGRPITTNGKEKDKKLKATDTTDITVIDMPTPAPQQRVQTSAVTDTSLMMPFPLRPTFLAQLIIPRDLTKDEAARLCAFIQALAVEA